MYKSRSYNTIGGKRLTVKQQFQLAEEVSKKQNRRVCTMFGGDFVKLVVGMKVMVTFNVDTEIDLANGTRGERLMTLCCTQTSQNTVQGCER